VRSKNVAPWTTAPPFEPKNADVRRAAPSPPRKKSSSQTGGAFLGSIALAIITLFSVGLGVFSYLRSEEAESRMLAYMKRYDESMEEQKKLQGTLGELAAKVGHAGFNDAKELLKAVEADLHKHGSQDSYPAQVAMLLEKIKTERFRADLAEEAAAKQRKRAEMSAPNFEAQLNELQAVIDKKNKELLGDREKNHELLGVLEKQVADLQEQLQAANLKMRQMSRDHEVASGKADQKIKLLTSAVRGMKEQKNFEDNDAENIRKETAAGLVTAVDSASKLVTISAGRNQGVRAGMLFRVFRPDVVGQPKDEVAVLEVLRMDDRSSVCRITRNDIRQPILRGDMAFNPLLGRGQGKGEVVAIVGKLDLDDDGEDDGDRIERLVTEQGGKVDYRLYPDGRERGRITTRLTWVVMDTPKEVAGTKEERERIQKYFAIRKEAIDFGIPILDSRKFAKEIGYRYDLKTTRP
jgi:hypothetical protein